MQDLLMQSNTSVLTRLAASNSLLAFDYDGTVDTGNCVIKGRPQEVPRRRRPPGRPGTSRVRKCALRGRRRDRRGRFSFGDPRLVTVRVGTTARSRAAFNVRSQRRIDTLLARLAGLRLRSSRSGLLPPNFP